MNKKTLLAVIIILIVSIFIFFIKTYKNKNAYTEQEIIDIAYNYLSDEEKLLITNKDSASISYKEKGGYYERIGRDKQGNTVSIKDKDIIEVFFTLNVDYLPNFIVVVLDNNTKEVLGMPFVD